MLEACCLTVSANSSYRHTTEDIALLTGLTISSKTQQEMVQSHDFEEPEAQYWLSGLLILTRQFDFSL